VRRAKARRLHKPLPVVEERRQPPPGRDVIGLGLPVAVYSGAGSGRSLRSSSCISETDFPFEDFMKPKKAVEVTSSILEGWICGIFVPDHFGAGTPTVDGARGFGGVGPEEHLKKLLAGIGLGDAHADVAAAAVVFASPEEQDAHAGGHHVIELGNVAGALRTQSRASTIGRRSAVVVFASDGTRRTARLAGREIDRRCVLNGDFAAWRFWGTLVDQGLRVFFARIGRGWRAKLASTRATRARRVVLFTLRISILCDCYGRLAKN